MEKRGILLLIVFQIGSEKVDILYYQSSTELNYSIVIEIALYIYVLSIIHPFHVNYDNNNASLNKTISIPFNLIKYLTMHCVFLF